ncbi:MAG TPA: LPS export ABC transporter periplasmic protein LptC [Vicinamibacterales bacterium]|jgi:LPS export ABC transporter protein LptC/lipopolysaccharide transport protein LptA
MTRWQRRARLSIAVFGAVFAVFVFREFKGRTPLVAPAAPVRTAPNAVVEITGGEVGSFQKSREDVRIKSQKQLIDADGSSKMIGVTIVTDERNGSRTFTIQSKEGHIGKGESVMQLDGDVTLEGSDGMNVRTEHATYTDADATIRAPGPVEYMRGHMTGHGVGMTWDKNRDVMSILDQAVINITPDEHGEGAMDVTAKSAEFARRDKYMRFLGDVKIKRSNQNIEAQNVLAMLTADEKRIDSVQLQDGAKIAMPKAPPGALQSLTGSQANLKYREGGDTIEHTLVSGNALIQLAGETGKPGRQIAASTLDIALAPDGSTPTALVGREAVQLTFPPEPGVPGRTIRSTALDAKGEPGRGLTRAIFTGSVQYREVGSGVDRAATAMTLDLGLKPGMSSIEDARFSRAVHFEDGSMAAVAAAGRYDLDKGTLALSGSEPGAVVPHVVNQQIVVDAVKIDINLDGPKVKADGNVKSELKPASQAKAGDAGNDVKLPTMLKQDQPVIVVANSLDYDGTTAKGTYTGSARLFQTDTTIKGDTIVVDNKAGNLAANGNVTSTTVLESTDKDKKTERQRSTAQAKDFKYDDATRRLTYTGDAHMNGPDGDMTAARIELYLKPSGDELDRAEAYENFTLREQNRETTGKTMVYTTSDEKYVIVGTPVKIVDECERETTGRTLTFIKSTDNIVVDGNRQTRTQTKGGNGKCTS